MSTETMVVFPFQTIYSNQYNNDSKMVDLIYSTNSKITAPIKML